MADPFSLVVSPLVNMVIEKVSSSITTEIGLLCGVKKEVEKLSSTFTAIQGVLEEAEEKQLSSPQLRDWLEKLQEAAYDADDILDSFTAEAHRLKTKQKVRNPWPHSFTASKASFQYDVAHKIKEIVERLDKISKEKQDFHLNAGIGGGMPETRDRPQHTGFALVESDVFGREDDKEKIIDLLVSDSREESDSCNEISVIPIVGMGGLGKTTLAQLVYNDGRVKNHFEFRMWVCVTDVFDLRRILKEIIEYHSEMSCDINLPMGVLQSRLLDLLAGKRFLLVLDDVWTENFQEWDPLRTLLKHGEGRSRVLVTSRYTKVSEIMGTKPPHLLSDLANDECWLLFVKIAFKDGSWGGRKDLENIGRQIVDRCKGLPLAVKAMGGLLRGNVDAKKWEKILRSEVWELEEENLKPRKPGILPALKLSYDHLPSHLKPCFTYCSIFPKAYDFDKNELVKLWMAEAFIQPRTRERTEEIGNECFDELFMRSFFQHSNIDNNDKRYKMHDLIHDLATSISSPYCCQVKDNEPCNVSEKSRHVSLLCNDVEPLAVQIVNKSSKLRTLLLPSEYLKNLGQSLDKIFLTLKYIRVLDLSSSTVLELPKSIGELKLLRYLDLSRTEIKMLPNSICSLYNLQTLKLLRCLWLFKLPKDLGNLINLRYLELDEMFWFKSSRLPSRMGSLTSLHTLHAFPVGCESGYGVGELKDMVYLRGTLHISNLQNAVNNAEEAKLNAKESIRKLVLEWSDRDLNSQYEATDERVLDQLQPHSNLQELRICHYRGIVFPSWMRDGLLQNLMVLTLSHCTKCRSLPSFSQLPHLGGLYMKGMLELEDWTEAAQCSSLNRLEISNCPKLKAMPEIFPSLRVLKIKRCDSLKALPILTPSLMFLQLLDNHILEDWREAAVISMNDQGQPTGPPRPSLLGILELKVVNCPKLKELPQIFAPQKLEISGCELLSDVPIPKLARRLQCLALDACQDGTLVRTIPGTNSLYSLVISNISGLSSLPKWPHLSGLKVLYIRDCKDLVSLSDGGDERWLQGLTSLKLLSIQGCPKLANLPVEGLPASLEVLTIGSCPSLMSLGQEGMMKSLTILKDVYINDCPRLQSMPAEGLSTSLQHLHIEGCSLLTERCRKDNGGGPDWPKIMHIPDLEIESSSIQLASSSSASASSATASSSAAWYHQLKCFTGQ